MSQNNAYEAFSQSAEDVQSHFDTNTSTGLSSQEAKTRLDQYGLN